ncbi:hypothetical protein C8R47DRAFT_1268089 [Mycena vitilis]|nr:hypothetical protein C8R47DRAFT_1268089 [Mycena vitilis]
MPPSSRSSSTSRRPPSRSSSTSRRAPAAPDAPPDLWGPLRQIPEQDWAQIRDLACPRNLDKVDDTVIAEFLAGYSAKLRASVHGCLPYLGDDVMPIELLAFHQGLKEAVKRLPEDFIQDHELDGIIWPLDAFESTDPPCLSRAEAKSLQRPMPVPYAVSRAEATPAPTPVVSRRPPPVASSPVSDYPFDFAARLQGSFFPPGLRREPTRAVDEDVNMEDPEVRHDESVASLPVDKAPSGRRLRPPASISASQPIPRFPGSGSGSRQRAGETASVMPPPASASVSSSSRQPSASSETSRDTTVAPRAVKVKHEPVSVNLSGKDKGGKNAKGSQEAPMEVSDSEQPPANAKVTRSKAPGARPFVAPSEILNLPAAATEEHLGGPGSLAHLRASAKIQDKEDSEPEVEVVGETVAETPGDKLEDSSTGPRSRQRQKLMTSFQILRTTGIDTFVASRSREKASNVKAPNQAAFDTLLTLLPAKERQDLPRSTDGKYFQISYDFIRQIMRVTDPMFGPRCSVCQLGGNVCHVRGYPAMCDSCSRGHGPKICSLAQPDEINNDVWGSLMAYTDLASENWKRTTETLGQSFKALESLETARTNLLAEYHHSLLNYLVVILRARRELNPTEFWERFTPKATGETLLRMAMAQQLTADTEVSRAYVWQYFEFEHLHLDIPYYESAYSFYKTYDEARDSLDPPGFYLVPCSEEDGLKPHWVPVTANDFVEVTKDDGKVPAGIRSRDLRKRLRYEKAFEVGQDKARPAHRDWDGTPFPHGVGLKPTGFLQKLWGTYGEALFDIEAVESSGESTSSDSELSDHTRAEMAEVAAGRATRKQARRERLASRPGDFRPDSAVSPPESPSRASGSTTVILAGEIKRPIARTPKRKPAAKADEMAVDADAGRRRRLVPFGSFAAQDSAIKLLHQGLNRRPSLCPLTPCHMQAPGDLRIDETVFPPASQALVRHLHTVPDLVCHRCADAKQSCTFIRWGARRQWWYQEFPPGGAEVFSYNEPAAFAELWHYLSFRELQPWYFEGCLEDGYPVSLIFSNKDYIDSITSAEFLRQLISVYQAEDRQLLVAFASRRLRRMPDFVPTPLESQASGTVVRRSAHSV